MSEWERERDVDWRYASLAYKCWRHSGPSHDKREPVDRDIISLELFIVLNVVDVMTALLWTSGIAAAEYRYLLTYNKIE